VHLSSRWPRAGGDGGTPAVEGPRAALPVSLPPGQAVDVALVVTAPDAEGEHRLEVTLVQELVAWFADIDPGSALRATVRVHAPG
jgi:hypothetical protein